MRGVVTREDRHLLAPLPREDLEKTASLHMMKAVFICETLFSWSQGPLPSLRVKPRSEN
ncbi:UNVERIFIED_CONTAM: hypothetical protein Slati_0958500 [Sesamum latifolium]|uniref:Uncharacterized protein n=1 Tax=Sesamum latifolium TaxID=2727402 RepID=A0AAW2XPX1_9LAMI